ncbi:hypothetical protein F3Y22_tig00110429pilonHSYRG00378 [Hibiscus syriacus]|uniref:Uncharacterized protein n=1 Tax=Hibiscus syriacus TaxID=106335 RepID=A0A6A3AKW6_HIBSY|nr:hypothetical protein F3Y22_tig00110429pilonHSYRG00378 [Hibiscus syriacus]
MQFQTHQLDILEQGLITEYNLILEQEETFWFQKSRVQWLQQGEKNMRFFHFSTITHRRSYKISMLRNMDGEWIKNPISIMSMVHNYFRNLFSMDSVVNDPLHCLNCPTIPRDKLQTLSRPELEDEVRNAFFMMKPWKASGEDGFHACVYQEMWCTFRFSLTEIVNSALETGSFPIELNHTLIALILKVGSSNSIKQFRPISLCTVAYKIITKVLVNRLRPLLDKLVSPLQASFIPGRQAVDNILLAQEFFISPSARSGIRHMFGHVMNMSSKLDLGKYLGTVNEIDRVNRRFLWGGNAEKRTTHLVSWEDVYKPKKFGGLGLRTMAKHNSVLLQKTEWRFLTQPGSLWVKALKACYGIQGDPIFFVMTHARRNSSCSHTWRSVLAGFKGLKTRMIRRIACRDRVLTNARLASWGIVNSADCANYGSPLENLNHILWECPIACSAWNKSNSMLIGSLFPLLLLITGRVKHNTDGASQGNPGVCSSVAVELFALRIGLVIAWKYNLRNVDCEVDAQVVIRLLESGDASMHPLGSVIEDIRSLRARNWSLTFHHSYHESNYCTDVLSKMGCGLTEELIIFDTPPLEICFFLDVDRRGFVP